MSLRNQNSKYWCFTINNPSADDELQMDRLRDVSTYLVYQLEQGENGTRHYQGYVEFSIRKKGSTVKNLIPRAHLQQRRGSGEQASEYCKKDESRLDGPFEFGTLATVTQGARNDLKAIKAAINEGRSLTDIAKDDNISFGSVIRYHRGFQWYLNSVDPGRAFKTQVVLFIGDAGTGKSTLANLFPKPYTVAEATSSQFYDGYDCREHETVIFDDFNGRIKFQTMLQLMDEHPYHVNVKGGIVNWKPKWLIICSNKQPDEWYLKASLDPRLWTAFNRRVDYRIDFYTPHQYYVREQSTNALPPAVRAALCDNYTEFEDQEQVYDIFN